MITEELKQLLLELGTDRIQHARSSFMEHLEGTAHLLRQWGNDEALCLAGLFHSIYGTQDFEHQSLGYEKREKLREAIGEEAEELAYLFSVCDRRTFFANLSGTGEATVYDKANGNTITIPRERLIRLLELEAANLLDQAPDPQQLPESTRLVTLGVARSLKGVVSDNASRAMDHYFNATTPTHGEVRNSCLNNCITSL